MADESIKPGAITNSTSALSTSPSLWTRYNRSLDSHPLYTKSLTSAVFYGIQEILASVISSGTVKSETLRRSIKMFAYGMTVSGPVAHYLYSTLDKIFSRSRSPGDLKSLVLKLIASNTVISPILNGLYLTALSLMAGLPPSRVIKVLVERLPEMMRVSWMIFPAIQFIAFRYMRQALWLPFFSLTAFVFGTYMNVMMKLKASQADKKAKKPSLPSPNTNSSDTTATNTISAKNEASVNSDVRKSDSAAR